MSVQTHGWESQLLTRAYEALKSPVLALHAPANAEALAEAHRRCADITRNSSKTFYLASNLLPLEKRLAARALYAFCRVTDDLVDKAAYPHEAEIALAEWRRRASLPHPPPDDLVLLAWADTQSRFSIPQGYAEQLIDGIARDLSMVRYASFDELAGYCYGVASTVGLMVMHLVGFAGEEALPYAVKLGVALQLTNILRDVGEDQRNGRIYLPQDELAAFGLSDADIAAGVVDDRWRAFMRFQIERTRHLYAAARPGIQMLDPDGRFAIAAAAELYAAILEDIEAHDYDVFTRRAHLSTWNKLKRLPGIWWGVR